MRANNPRAIDSARVELPPMTKFLYKIFVTTNEIVRHKNHFSTIQ